MDVLKIKFYVYIDYFSFGFDFLTPPQYQSALTSDETMYPFHFAIPNITYYLTSDERQKYKKTI